VLVQRLAVQRSGRRQAGTAILRRRLCGERCNGLLDRIRDRLNRAASRFADVPIGILLKTSDMFKEPLAWEFRRDLARPSPVARQRIASPKIEKGSRSGGRPRRPQGPPGSPANLL